jgi:hypothetical protein
MNQRELGTMKKRLTAAAVGGAMLASMLVIVATAPAGAAANITATSVALNDSADCDNDADLDLGMEAGTVAIEGGIASTIGDDDIGSFEQPSTLSNFSGVTDYGISMDNPLPEGSIVGTLAYVGDSPPTSANAAEWFILYRCDNGGANEVLYECFGDYGTCPHSADEALALIFSATVSPTAPLAGETITVSATGCVFDIGGTYLSEPGGPALDSALDITVGPDGSFNATLKVPADLAPGTALEVFVGCGTVEEPLVSETIGITVGAPATTTSTTTQPTEQVRPRFTG